MDKLTRFNMHEWEAEAKRHAGEEAFAQPLLDAIAEIRSKMGDTRSLGELLSDSQTMNSSARAIVYDDRLTDCAVRLLLANLLEPPFGVREGNFPR